MESVENKTFGAGAVVFMDDKYFIRCRFDGCMLVYGGGEYGWIECTFGTVQISFTGSADRVINFAKNLGVIGQPAQQPPPKGIPGSSKGEH
jgi:hypothetical protein